MTIPVLLEFSCCPSVIRDPTLQSQTMHRGLGKIPLSWEKLAVSIQSRGSAVTPSLIAAMLKIPASQNPPITYLSLNSITRLWSFYVSHLGLEAACVVMWGGVDIILYHHRDNLDVLYSYGESYLRSYFLLDPDRRQLLSLSFSLSPVYAHIISLIQPFQMKNELFLKTNGERTLQNKTRKKK